MKLSAALLVKLLSLFTLLSGAAWTSAQPYYRGELELAQTSSFGAFPAQTGLTLAGRLEAGYDLELGGASPLALSLVLDPNVRASQSAAQNLTFEPGLTELYALTAQGNVDVSLGVERLPLERARLSVPYSVETVGERGVRRGVPGVRGVFYCSNWRVRGAVFYRDVAGQTLTKNVTPLASLRRTFDGFDLEAQALYQNGWVVGLGGSGLVGDLVVYGEAWLLTGPLEGRGTLGLNGNLNRGTWTLEAAYLTPGEGSLKDDDELTTPAQRLAINRPRPAVLGQLTLPLGDEGDMNLSLNGNAFLGPDAARAGVSANYTLFADAELTLSAGARFGPEAAVASLGLSIKEFF